MMFYVVKMFEKWTKQHTHDVTVTRAYYLNRDMSGRSVPIGKALQPVEPILFICYEMRELNSGLMESISLAWNVHKTNEMEFRMHIQNATTKMVNECLVVNAGCGWIERYYVFGMLTTSMKWKHAILIKYFEKENWKQSVVIQYLVGQWLIRAKFRFF